MLRDFDLTMMLIRIPVVLVALSFHELAHGLAAYWLGDKTAKSEGRITLNPIKHIDPIGLLMIIFVGFGWAKPVMVNPHNFKDVKKDMALVSLAGPITNFILAFVGCFVFVALFRFMPGFIMSYIPYMVGIVFIQINIVLGVFNLLPIPPLDGSKFFGYLLPDRYYYQYIGLGNMGMIIVFMLVWLGVIGGILSPMVQSVQQGFMWLPMQLFLY
jgi:Zn-dependent protease